MIISDHCFYCDKKLNGTVAGTRCEKCGIGFECCTLCYCLLDDKKLKYVHDEVEKMRLEHMAEKH